VAVVGRLMATVAEATEAVAMGAAKAENKRGWREGRGGLGGG